jgi:hypothetical protein
MKLRVQLLLAALFLVGGEPATWAVDSVTVVGGYYTLKDRFQHAIVATTDGGLHEVYFDPQRGIFSDDLGCFGDVVAAASFQTPDDGYQHVIVATADGKIREVFFDPGIGIHVSEPPLASFPGVVALAAFVTNDDHYRIVIVGTRDGNVREIFYHPSIGAHVSEPPLGNFPGLVALAGFATTDDMNRIVLVGTRDGNVREIFYRPSIGVHVSQPPLATFPGLVALAGFQADDDKYRIAIVATSDGEVHEIFYHPSIGVHVSQPPLANIPGVTGVAGYFTPDDSRRHVIASDGDGGIHEIFYNPRSGKGHGVLRKYGRVGITHVELNQAIQDMKNAVPLFRGKRTLVRTYIHGGLCSTSGPPLTGVTVAASIFEPGNLNQPVWGPVLVGPLTLPRAASRDDLAQSVNFELPANGPNGAPWNTLAPYTLRVSTLPGQATGESLDVSLRFYDSVPFHFRVFWDSASGHRVTRAALDRGVARLRALWPVSDIIVHDSNDVISGIGWGTLGMQRALALMGDQTAIANGQQPPNCSSCFFITMPWIAAGNIPFGLANPWPNHDSQVAFDETDINWSTGTLAQEPSHNLDRLHASSAHSEQAPTDPSFPYSHGEISDNAIVTVGNVTSRGSYYGADPGTNPAHPAGQWWVIPAYDARDGTHHHDYMSYGAWVDIWTSAYTYQAICGANRKGWFDSWYMKASDLAANSLPPNPPCPEPTNNATWDVLRYGNQEAAGSPSSFLIVRGVVRKDGTVTFEPSYQVVIREHLVGDPDTGAHNDLEGDSQVPMEVALVDREGRDLVHAHVHPPTHGADTPFAVTLKWDSRVVAAVVRRGGREIGRLRRLTGPPSARFLALPHGALDGPFPVRWQVRTAGDQTQATAMLFSRDGGDTWQVLALDLKESTFTLDPIKLPGTRQGRLRLLVTDGMNTTTVDGPADLQIKPKPPRVFITDPPDGITVPPGGRLVLRGNALSPQDGLLPETVLSWYAGERLIGRGSLVDVRGLSAGRQELRLEATDGQGLRTAQHIAVSLDANSVAVRGDAAGAHLPSLRP